MCLLFPSSNAYTDGKGDEEVQTVQPREPKASQYGVIVG